MDGENGREVEKTTEENGVKRGEEIRARMFCGCGLYLCVCVCVCINAFVFVAEAVGQKVLWSSGLCVCVVLLGYAYICTSII